jgi:hypothetical protein
MRSCSRLLAPGAAALALTLGIARPARAQFGGSLDGMSVALSTNLPTGHFADKAATGFGLTVRQGGSETERWSGRGVFGFDYFTGKNGYHDIQLIAAGFDFVHRTPGNGFYQFGGLSLSTTRFTLNSGPSTLVTQTEQDFGLTGGVGVNYETSSVKWFLEFAATTYFTRGDNSAWFPVRVGLRF